MKLTFLFVSLILICVLSNPTLSQKNKTPQPTRVPDLVRTTSRHEVRRLGYGGSVSIIGAPDGSISIEGWTRNEVDISAEIQLRANTEADLNLLAALNTFVLDEDLNHIRVLSTGTHDKEFMRRVAKKFPKTLLGLPWKIDYRIRLPIVTDVEINAGRGPISISGVEGNIRLSATESEVKLNQTGGTLMATVAVGKVNLNIPSRSWRGIGGELRVAAGELNLDIPNGFSGDIDAEILRSGRIENKYEGLEDRRTRGTPGSNQLKATAGAGGAFFKLVMGDGVIRIKKQ